MYRYSYMEAIQRKLCLINMNQRKELSILICGHLILGHGNGIRFDANPCISALSPVFFARKVYIFSIVTLPYFQLKNNCIDLTILCIKILFINNIWNLCTTCSVQDIVPRKNSQLPAYVISKKKKRLVYVLYLAYYMYVYIYL